jgi:MFS family permease
MTPIAGRLSDMYGKKKMLLMIVGIYTLGISLANMAAYLSRPGGSVDPHPAIIVRHETFRFNEEKESFASKFGSNFLLAWLRISFRW